ncbi:MAG: SIMPL domain-containing protein, partial [Candidatus Woesebacteria bacterium]
MTKLIAGSAIGTIVAAGVVFGMVKILGPIPLSVSQVTTNKQSSFDVTGQGEITTAPDSAEINLGIQATDSTVQAVQDKGNRTINQITQDLLSMGVEKADIKTVNYSLYPNYDYRSGSQKINGYALNVSLQVKAKDFTKISQIVDTATKDGANQVGGVSFTLSDDKRKEIEDQAREAAVKEAKAKAESLSRLAGV